MRKLSGVMPALVTPFDDTGKTDTLWRAHPAGVRFRRHRLGFHALGSGFVDLRRGRLVVGLDRDSLGMVARGPASATRPCEALPNLQCGAFTEWMGHRPALPDTVAVLSASARARGLFQATNHGNLGLTFAATTARLTSDVITGAKPGVDLHSYRINRFRSCKPLSRTSAGCSISLPNRHAKGRSYAI